MNTDMKKYIKLTAIFGLGVFLVYLAIHYLGAITGMIGTAIGALEPFFLGCIFAYVLAILMERYEKIYFPKSKNKTLLKSKRLVCMLLSFATIVIAIILIFKILVPQLVLSFGLIVEEVPKVVEKIYVWLMEQEELKVFINEMLSGKEFDWKTMATNVGNMIVSGAGGVMNAMISMVSVTVSAVVQIVLAIIFAIYILMGKEKLVGQIQRVSKVYVKESVRNKVSYVLKVVNDTFRSFVVGQCMEAVIIGCLCAFGMKILGLPYAGMTGTVVGLTALIPVMGAYIGAVVGAFMICTVSPMDAIIFLIFLVVLQQLEGNLIYPKVVGTSIGLPGLWVVLSVTACGGIWGVPGMLFGVPVVASLYKLLKADVRKKYVPDTVAEEEVEASEEEENDIS